MNKALETELDKTAKEPNKLGPQNTGAGGLRTMTRRWFRNWSRRMENNDEMLVPELEPNDGESQDNGARTS